MPRITRPDWVPAYQLHKPSGQAKVRISGRDIWLGKHGSPDSVAAYNAVVAQWKAGAAVAPPKSKRQRREAVEDPSITEVILAYWEHADARYKVRGTRGKILRALEHLRTLYGPSVAAEFGAPELEAYQEHLIGQQLARTTICSYVAVVRAMFKFAVRKRLVPASVLHDLSAAEGLRVGQSGAKEPEPVGPVPEAHVAKTLTHARPIIRDLIEVQLLCGMRPGELVRMTSGEIDTSGKIWIYSPSKHKLTHKRKLRQIPIGPRAQKIVKRYLRKELDRPLFSPAAAEEQRNAERRAARTSAPSVNKSRDAQRRKQTRKRPPSDRYTVRSLNKAIERAAKRAGVPHWTANQLRHSRATLIRKLYGIEAASAVLGHLKLSTSEIYAERNLKLAEKVAREVG